MKVFLADESLPGMESLLAKLSGPLKPRQIITLTKEEFDAYLAGIEEIELPDERWEQGMPVGNRPIYPPGDECGV